MAKPTTDEIATTAKDIDVFAGWLRRLENPDPVLRSESGGLGLKLYDEVARDAHSASVLQTRYLAVAGCEWEVVPASAAAADQAAAELVEAALSGCNFSLAVQELLQAVLYGFYVAEVMWASIGGRWLPAAITGKHPRRFSFTMARELRLLTPSDMIEGEAVPERKFIVFTWGDSDNPYGRGLGQKLWWPVWFKKHGIKWWLVFLEKFGMPTPVGKYPPGTDPEQQADLLDALEAIQTETGIKIPDTMKIEYLEAARAGKPEYAAMCEYMDRQISKAVLGQTATTEGTAGKLGNEDAQNDVREDIRKADADLLCETLNRTLVRWIVDLNLGPRDAYPKLWIKAESASDLNALAGRDKILLGDLGFGRRVPETYISDTYGIPLAEEGEAVIGAPAGDGTGDRRVAPTDGGAFAEAAAQDTVDRQAAVLEQAAERPVAGMVDAIRAIVARAESLEALRDEIAAAWPELDAGELADAMAEALAAAQMAGRYEILEGL
jgi:phage gp29-like protein